MALNFDLMLTGILILSCLRFQTAIAASRNCYKCASPYLKTNWYLTGYPIPLVNGPNENVYTGDCNQISANLPTESCDGPCVAYMFEYVTGTTRANSVVVRGCYKTLTGDTTVQNITSKQCVLETRKDWDAEKNPVPVRRQISFCGDNDKCNQDGEFNCGDLPTNRESKTCVCNDAECGDKSTCATQGYCYKKEIIVNDGKPDFQQGCTNVNIYGYDTCKTIEGKSYTATRVVATDMKETQCFCETDRCNSAATFKGLFGLSVFSLITLFWKMSI